MEFKPAERNENKGSRTDLARTDCYHHQCYVGNDVVDSVGYSKEQFERNFAGSSAHVFRHIFALELGGAPASGLWNDAEVERIRIVSTNLPDLGRDNPYSYCESLSWCPKP